MKKDSFFSKSYLYPSLWAVLLGILGFSGGLIWKNLTGPEKVVVLNKEPKDGFNKDTTITIIRFQPDEGYFDDLARLTTRELEKNYLSSEKKSKSKKDADSLAYQIAKEYQIKYDSLRLSIINKEIRKPLLSDNLIPIPELNPSYDITQIKRPKFNLPSVVSGYSEGNLNSFAIFSLNSNSFKRNDKIEIILNFFDKTIIGQITPLFVELVEPKSANSVYYIWGEQYDIKSKKNILMFSADFKPGKYQLGVGFYRLDEINRKYPPFYCKKFNVEIQ